MRTIKKACHILLVIVICLAVLRMRVLVKQAKAAELHFGDLPQREISLVPARGSKAALSASCGKHAPGEEKCSCVNAAIFKHDSGWATAGVGARAKNPCNMRVPATWTPAAEVPAKERSVNGTFAKFSSLSAGIDACVELYARHYKNLGPQQLVSRWTNGGGDHEYRKAVANCFM